NVPQRRPDPRSRMRQSRTSGSVGGLGGNSQAYPTMLDRGRFPRSIATRADHSTRSGHGSSPEAVELTTINRLD
ncbi:MAG: hypothetical protein ACYTDU_20890, partial [Planctomycetota bacterium]